ncbi:MAG: hypothetical protein EHM70_25050 [Chloroflexota bacterium]|nr:MAG: hypothetical protein EHM70_25050 [Chloroflexota bacterium]
MLLCLAALALLAACTTAQQANEAGSSTSPPPESAALPVTGAETADGAVSRGRDLFRNKGCVTCHANDRVEGESGMTNFDAPDLSDYANDHEFLRRWLVDPQAVRPGTAMPNLRLSEEEIEDLIVFLNSD